MFPLQILLAQPARVCLAMPTGPPFRLLCDAAGRVFDSLDKAKIHSLYSEYPLKGSITMTSNYFVRYLPLLIHFALATLLAAAIITLSYLIGQHKANKSKMSPYECGMEPVGDVRQRFSVKFYLVGMLFILFDVEAVFLFPWAILLRKLKMFGFWEMMTYVFVILVGFVYVWKKGVLDWNKSSREEAL
jgi:NADH-quinone oxidoreductase subunit A